MNHRFNPVKKGYYRPGYWRNTYQDILVTCSDANGNVKEAIVGYTLCLQDGGIAAPEDKLGALRVAG